jgi:membrane protein required for colicin V production
LNSLDFILIILLIIPAALGIKKGLIKSVITTLSIILGIYLATKFHPGLNLVIRKFIEDSKWMSMISFSLIVIIVYLIGAFIAGKISKINFITKFIDKVGGFALGLLKGALIASLLLLFVSSFGMLKKNTASESLLYPYVYNVAPKTYNIVRLQFFDKNKEFLDLNKFFKIDSTFNTTK